MSSENNKQDCGTCRFWIYDHSPLCDKCYKGSSYQEKTDVSNIAIIDYIEKDCEVAIPIDEMFNVNGSHITKKEYGKVLIKYLVKELRKRYC